MPNNTCIMISFAACFALTLSTYATGDTALAPSIRNLIDEAAGVLERIGTVTPHRNGLSVLYAKYLRRIVRRVANEDNLVNIAQLEINLTMPTAPIDDAQQLMATQEYLDQQALWPETLQFSTMSDDQIEQVLNQPGNEFDPAFGGLSWDDMTNFVWMHLPEFGV